MDAVNNKLKEFIERHLPDYTEKVEQIEIGVINFTFRIHLKNELSSIVPHNLNDNGLLALIHEFKLRTLIVKIAYPYCAALGVEAGEVPLDRQVIEKKALEMFHSFSPQGISLKEKSVDLSPVLRMNEAIKVSRILFYSELDNILVMEDLGTHVNLQQWFISKATPSSIQSVISFAHSVGTQLGNFVLDMQVCSLSYIDEINMLLNNKEIKLIYLMAFTICTEKLSSVYHLTDVPELTSIVNRYFEDDVSRSPRDCQVLAHTDLWAGNLLIDDYNGTLAILDWEFAALRSPAFDLALLLVRSRIHTKSDPLYDPLLSFTTAFLDAYRDKAIKEKVNWYVDEREKFMFAWSLGIVYGAALIDASTVQKCCLPYDEKCSHRCDSVKEAADYIRHCQSGPDKTTYDFISHDPLLGRLFQTKNGHV